VVGERWFCSGSAPPTAPTTGRRGSPSPSCPLRPARRRVAHADLSHVLQDLAGHGTDVVRRCPRISASSRTPPRDIRTNLRLVARATDDRAGLATPGGPTGPGIGAFTLSTRCCTTGTRRAFLDLFQASDPLPGCSRRAPDQS
jgi:hypothetical protein